MTALVFQEKVNLLHALVDVAVLLLAFSIVSNTSNLQVFGLPKQLDPSSPIEFGEFL
jgi:hypothetical protein